MNRWCQAAWKLGLGGAGWGGTWRLCGEAVDVEEGREVGWGKEGRREWGVLPMRADPPPSTATRRHRPPPPLQQQRPSRVQAGRPVPAVAGFADPAGLAVLPRRGPMKTSWKKRICGNGGKRMGQIVRLLTRRSSSSLVRMRSGEKGRSRGTWV